MTPRQALETVIDAVHASMNDYMNYRRTMSINTYLWG